MQRRILQSKLYFRQKFCSSIDIKSGDINNKYLEIKDYQSSAFKNGENKEYTTKKHLIIVFMTMAQKKFQIDIIFKKLSLTYLAVKIFKINEKALFYEYFAKKEYWILKLRNLIPKCLNCGKNLTDKSKDRNIKRIAFIKL